MWILIVCGGFSLACAVHLWTRRRVGVARKAAWTLALLAPVVGPLFYFATFDGLSPNTVKAREYDPVNPIS